MARLIQRTEPTEINQHQNHNGLEWSTNEQNRLANELESARDRANLRHEIGIFQIERGDTLGAVVNGLTGHIDWQMRVDYRSNRLGNRTKPNRLNNADLIYPGQYVWIEDDTIIVADNLPAAPTPAAPTPTAPTPAAPTPAAPTPAAPTPAALTPVTLTPAAPTLVASSAIPPISAAAFHFTSGMFEDGGRSLDSEFIGGRHNNGDLFGGDQGDWLLDGQSPQQEQILFEDNSGYAEAADELNYMGLDSLSDFDAINGTNYADQFETYATDILTNPALFDDFIADLRTSTNPDVQAAFADLEPGINTMIRRQQELEYIKTLENWLLINGFEASVLRGPTQISGNDAPNGYLGILYQMFAAEEASGTATSIDDILTRSYTIAELNELLQDASGNPDTIAIAQFRHVQSQLRPQLAALQTVSGGAFADTIDAGGSVSSLQTQAIQRRWALAQYADQRGGGETIWTTQWSIEEPAESTGEQMMQGMLLPMVDLPNLRTRFQEAFEAAETRAEADITEDEVALALDQRGIERSNPDYDTILQQALESSRTYQASQIKLEHILSHDGFDRSTIDGFTGGNNALTDVYLEVAAEYKDTLGVGLLDLADRTLTWKNITGTAVEFGVITALSATGFGLGAGVARAAMLGRTALTATRLGRAGAFVGENMIGGGLGTHGGMSLAYGGLEFARSGDLGRASQVFGDTLTDRNLLVANVVSGGTLGWINRATSLRGSLLRGAGAAPLEATAVAGNPLMAETAEERREWGQQFMMSLMLNSFANQHMLGGAASRFSEAQTRNLGRFLPNRLRMPSSLRGNRIDLSRSRTATLPHPLPDAGFPLEVNGVVVGHVRPRTPGSPRAILYEADGVTSVGSIGSTPQRVTVDGVRVDVGRPRRGQPYQVSRSGTTPAVTEALSSTSTKWIQRDRGTRYTTENVVDGATQTFKDPRGPDFSYTRHGDELRLTLPDGTNQVLRNGDVATIHGERVRFELDTATNQVSYTRAVGRLSNPATRLRRYWQQNARVEDLGTAGANLNRSFNSLGRNTIEFQNLPDGTPVTFNRRGNLELQVTRNGSNFTVQIDGTSHILNSANPTINIRRARGLRPLTIALDGNNLQITRRLRPQAGRTTPIIEDLSTRTTGAVSSWQNLRSGQPFRGTNLPPSAEFKWTIDGTPGGATQLSIRRNGTNLEVIDASGTTRTVASGSPLNLPNGRRGVTRVEWDGANVQVLRNSRAPRIATPEVRFETSGGVLRLEHNLTAPGQTAHVTIPRGTNLRGQSIYRSQPIDLEGLNLTISPDGRNLTVTSAGRTRVISVGGRSTTATTAAGVTYKITHESVGIAGGARLRIDLESLPTPPIPPVPPVSGAAATRAFAGGTP